MLLVQFLIILLVGFFIGLLQGGIKITITKKNEAHDEKPVESLVNELPPEVIHYYDQTHGQNRF